MSPERKRAKHSAEKPESKQGSFEIALPIRIGIALVLVLISALFKMPVLVRTILLIVSAVIAGYDIFLSAVDLIAEKQFFSPGLVVLFSAVLGFVVGYPMESAIMVIIYQASGYAIDYTKKRALRSAQSLVEYQDEDIRTRLSEILSQDDAGKMKLQQTLESSAVFVLHFVLVLGLLYALLGPFISGISYRVSIHRALMILLVSSPLSVCVSEKNTTIVATAIIIKMRSQIYVRGFFNAYFNARLKRLALPVFFLLIYIIYQKKTGKSLFKAHIYFKRPVRCYKRNCNDRIVSWP